MNSGPNTINALVQTSDGFLTLRELSNSTFPPGDPLGNLTLDFQLDENITITTKRIEIGINATFFNIDKGYILPSTDDPLNVPTYDPQMPSQFQVFISNYFLNSAARSYFEKNSFTYTIFGEEFPPDNETVAPFVTDTIEGLFPFVTSKFGKNVSCDIAFTVRKVSDIYLWEANKTDVNN